MTSSNYRGRYWVFTLNNYNEDDEQRLGDLGNGDETTYLVYGRETASTGTPHLQGYVVFSGTGGYRLRAVREAIGLRAHVEKARGSPTQASDYCKKDGDYEEYGEIPAAQGRRTDWEHFRAYIINHATGRPSARELFREFPGIYARYGDRLHEFIRLIREPIALTSEQPRPGWQDDLWGRLKNPPDDRSIYLVVDPDGNSGKSWFCKFMMTQQPDDVQVLRVGKRDDVAHSIDPKKSIFLFDIPRSQMEFFQFSVPEMIKDRLVYSPKYASTMKILERVPHVVIFCNELPETIPLSEDRINIINI